VPPHRRGRLQVNVLNIDILTDWQLAFSATVAGLTGQYLHQHKSTSAWDEKRFIYTEVVAAIGILFSLIFLFPFAGSFLHWPADLLLFILYIVAFALLTNVSFIHGILIYFSS
jgi:hypothetical protein